MYVVKEHSRNPSPLFLIAGQAYLILLARPCSAPDTEIDWVAYMEQVAQFVAGERDYTKMEGGTGPLVYPAAHVYVYTGLYYLTDRGKNILLAQQTFAVLYMATLAVVMLCYWKAKVGFSSTTSCAFFSVPSFLIDCKTKRKHKGPAVHLPVVDSVQAAA